MLVHSRRVRSHMQYSRVNEWRSDADLFTDAERGDEYLMPSSVPLTTYQVPLLLMDIILLYLLLLY